MAPRSCERNEQVKYTVILLAALLAGCETQRDHDVKEWAAVTARAPDPVPHECDHDPKPIPRMKEQDHNDVEAAKAYLAMKHDNKKVRALYAQCRVWAKAQR
jgi:hypothetical protein